MALTENDASTESAEYVQMKKEWGLISDIMAGPLAIRARSETYLPQFSREGNEAYKRRLAQAPWRPEFTDIVRSISSKPFGKEVMVKGDGNPDIVGKLDLQTKARSGGIVSDIDGRGNGLTVFAQEWFRGGVAKGLHAVLVDFPEMQPNATRADEKAAGARPYWVQIPADNIIALYTVVVGGKEIISHIRIREWIIRRDGYAEKRVEQIRVMEPGLWQLWERDPDSQKLSLSGEGKILRGGKFDSVPVVLYFTGDRLGDMAVRPPMSDLAHMQIELYQALSRKEMIETMAGSPMLAANGMAPPDKGEEIEVGPGTILFAPPGGEEVKPYWDYVQPVAANMTELRNSVAALQADMRRIGLQPLTEVSGNPTATGRAIDAAKAHSAVKAWALMLNDAIEAAFVFTAEWMGVEPDVQTEVSTDFSVVPYAAEPLKALAAARATGDLSRKTFLEMLRRFDALSPDWDYQAELALIAAEPPRPAQETVQIRT